jgi:hypothetical protein
MPTAWRCLTTASFALAFASAPALADAIDGNWCHPDGRRFEIAGPTIVTPNKTRTQGQYDRHYFSYVVPASDPGAGTAIAMTLLGETTVRIKSGDRPEETWTRCGPPISQDRGLPQRVIRIG